MSPTNPYKLRNGIVRHVCHIQESRPAGYVHPVKSTFCTNIMNHLRHTEMLTSSVSHAIPRDSDIPELRNIP